MVHRKCLKTLMILPNTQKREQTCAVSFNEFQSIWWDGALLVELTEQQFLNVTGRIRDTLFFVTIAIGFGVEYLGVYSEN